MRLGYAHPMRPLHASQHRISIRDRLRLILRRGCLDFAVLGLALFGFFSDAAADSSLLLESRLDFTPIRATTFDEDGRAVGESFLKTKLLEAGVYHIQIDLKFAGGGSNHSEAILVEVPNPQDGEGLGVETPRLRLTEQRAQAIRKDGVKLDLLVIDHLKGRASCYPSNPEDPVGRHVDLPSDDRIVNVPLQLLFGPLARGDVDELEFQIASCRKKPVIHEIRAVAGPRSRHRGRNIIEIRYGPDLGRALSFLASRLLPRFSVWLDADDATYIGHRMPLYRKGPEVLVLREGIRPPDLEVAAN